MSQDFRSQIICNCKPSILVVDDNAFNLSIQMEIIENQLNQDLDNMDFFIEKANDGTVAVEMIKKCLEKPCKCANRVFKLIVMDL